MHICKFFNSGILSPTAWTLRPDPDALPTLKECDENKVEQEEEHTLHDFSGSSATKPSLHRSSSPSCQSGGPSYLHSSPG